VTSGAEATDLSALPFEKALAELEEIVRRLERGDVPLEDSIAIYERGEALKKHCEALLKRAEARIEKITIGRDGQATGVTPLDVET
jgi:exodeoxyribonuclease VII small subunit